MLATGPGNTPAVQVWTGITVRFSSRTVQKPNPLLLGSPNPALYSSTRGFPLVWLDPSGPIYGFAFCVVLCMDAFRYLTVYRKTFTMVRRCSFGMNLLPLCSKYVVKRSMPHPENECQWSVNDFRSCILGTQSGHWLQLVITEVLASFIGESRSDMLPAPSWKWASNERQRLKVSHLG